MKLRRYYGRPSSFDYQPSKHRLSTRTKVPIEGLAGLYPIGRPANRPDDDHFSENACMCRTTRLITPVWRTFLPVPRRFAIAGLAATGARSEERRVGKE